MSTTSTKSSAPEMMDRKATAEADAANTHERVWQIASIAILIEAAMLRLYDLEIKPLHHDEGVNGFFLTRLFREGAYQYDPANYHGPSLYYFALVSSYLFGLNTQAIRLAPAVFGVGTVWLTLRLRRYIGSPGALSAAALIAVSPGAVYLSRYFIHESLFVFFTLGLAVAALKYSDEGRPIHLLLASVSAALLFATKETAIISVSALVIAAIVSSGYVSMRIAFARDEKREAESDSRRRASKRRLLKISARFGSSARIALLLLAASAIFVIVFVSFYSSFFTYFQGVSGAISSLKIWARTGESEHVHAWHTYILWLWQEESPILVLGGIGAALALWRASDRASVFLSLWCVGILMAYSLVPYKTPWLTLNIIVPLAVVAGYALNFIYSRAGIARSFALALAGAAVAICLYQTIALNFIHYDDDNYPYVYAHTRREFLPILGEIARIADRAGTGADTTIAVTSPDYWPLPWYLRNYRRVGYYGRPFASSDAIIIGDESQEVELQSALGDRYQKIGSYTLRPGVNLSLYARGDLATQ